MRVLRDPLVLLLGCVALVLAVWTIVLASNGPSVADDPALAPFAKCCEDRGLLKRAAISAVRDLAAGEARRDVLTQLTQALSLAGERCRWAGVEQPVFSCDEEAPKP